MKFDILFPLFALVFAVFTAGILMSMLYTCPFPDNEVYVKLSVSAVSFGSSFRF